MATALPALTQSTWVDPKTGISYGVPAGYEDIWPSIPDDARELFIKTSKGTRESYASAKREQLNNPQEWAKRQARIDLAAANPQFGFKSKPVLSPEQKLRLGLDTTPNAFLGNTRYVNGNLVTEIDPSALDNIYLLTHVLAQEASTQNSLAALGREAAPGIERLRMKFLALKSAKQAVLEMTFTQDQRKFLQDIDAESKKIAKLLAGALPEVVIFGRNINESSTIADLLSKATLTEAQFENFLLEIAPSDLEIEKILSAKEGKLRAIDEPIDMSESRKFADYMRDGILRRYSPADGPSLLQSLDRMNNIIGDLLSLTSRENPAAAPLLRERYGHANSHFPGVAMLGNSLVTVSQAYASGDDIAFREALLGEFFNYFLPPAYGVITTALTHSRRNKVQQGLISVGTLGVFHLLEAATPGAGQIIMAFELVNGLPKLVENLRCVNA